MALPTIPEAIEIRIPDKPLPWKLSAVAAALRAIREAHGPTMPPGCWEHMSRAEESLVEAMLCTGRQALPGATTRHLNG